MAQVGRSFLTEKKREREKVRFKQTSINEEAEGVSD